MPPQSNCLPLAVSVLNRLWCSNSYFVTGQWFSVVPPPPNHKRDGLSCSVPAEHHTRPSFVSCWPGSCLLQGGSVPTRSHVGFSRDFCQLLLVHVLFLFTDSISVTMSYWTPSTTKWRMSMGLYVRARCIHKYAKHFLCYSVNLTTPSTRLSWSLWTRCVPSSMFTFVQCLLRTNQNCRKGDVQRVGRPKRGTKQKTNRKVVA
jgi:hypothetical protein